MQIRTKSGDVIDVANLRDALRRAMGETPPNTRSAWTLRDAMHALDALEAAHRREDALRKRVKEQSRGHDCISCVRDSVLAILDGDEVKA